MFRMLRPRAVISLWLAIALLVVACGVKKVDLKTPAAIKNARTLDWAADRRNKQHRALEIGGCGF
jgi:hypothetical protein